MAKDSHICLINPPCPWLINDRAHHPMSVLVLAGHLRAEGVQTQILDLASKSHTLTEIPEADIYGVTAVTAQIPIATEIAERLAEEQPRALRILGGIHATVLPEEVLETTKFQIAVIGEGELTLAELATGTPTEEVSGIAYRRDGDGKIVNNGPRPLIDDLDALAMPAFDMIDMASYKPAGLEGAITIMTSRGCPFDCLFCVAVPRKMRKYRQRSLQKVIEEIETVRSQYGINVFSFQDELFSLNKQRFLAFCEAFEALGLRWRFMTRVDTIDRTMIRRAIEAGCFEMCIGIESGSQKILDMLNKQTQVEDNARVLDLARQEGLATMAYLITASPGEDEKTIDETIEFLREHPADEYGCMLYTPFPGTAVWREPEKYGFELPGNYGQYQYLNRDGTGISLHKDKDRAIALHNRLFEFIKDHSSFVRKDRTIGVGQK